MLAEVLLLAVAQVEVPVPVELTGEEAELPPLPEAPALTALLRAEPGRARQRGETREQVQVQAQTEPGLSYRLLSWP